MGIPSTLFRLTITLIITVFIISFSTCYAQINGFETCGRPFRCGNIENMIYPFWGGERPDYCGGGHNDFQLNCDGEVALININTVSATLRVLDIVELNRTLILATDDLVDDNCPSDQYGTWATWPSSVDPFLFRSLLTNRDVVILYTCDTNLSPALPVLPNMFNCTADIYPGLRYFVLEGDQNGNLQRRLNCRDSISVPVNMESVIRLAREGATVSDLRSALDTGFPVQWMGNMTLCGNCESSGGRCGSVSNSSSFTCFCAEGGVYNTRCPGPSRGSIFRTRLMIGVLLGGAAVFLIILMTIICYRKRGVLMVAKNKQMFNKDVEAFLAIHGTLAPKRYSYLDIKKMTNSFTDKLGQGGYGIVFKGKLLDGRLVAVKVLTDDANSTNGGDFVNEVASISRTSHINIVTLLGFCLERNKRALIYEFMPNKSLDKFISKSVESSFSLDLETLYKIAVGTARGLEYLHRGCNTRIVHFDIKPENILLDEDFCPKISDFGMSKLCQRKNSVVSMIGARGTIGYIAPEVFSRAFGGVSHKSDVYSYGMMIINMVGAGNKNEDTIGLGSTKSDVYFPDFIYKRFELGENLTGILSKEGREEDTAKKMVLVSLWCIQTNPLDRPSMGKVVEMLEGDIGSIQMPLKPTLFPPALMNEDSCSPQSSSYEIKSLAA